MTVRSVLAPLLLAIPLVLLPADGAAQAQAATAPPASVAASPYTARVSVPDQTAASRDKALREALLQVLTTVSGRGDPAFSTILGRGAALVQTYAYQPETGGGFQLEARFDPAGIDQALREQGLPVFGVAAAAAEDLAIEIEGIASAADYARVLQQLRGQPGVERLMVSELDPQGRRLRLQLRVQGGSTGLAAGLGPASPLRPLGADRYEVRLP